LHYEFAAERRYERRSRRHHRHRDGFRDDQPSVRPSLLDARSKDAKRMTSPATEAAPMTRREWLLSDRPQSRLQARLGRAYVTWRQFSENRLAVVGLAIIVLLLLLAAFADLIATHSPVIGDLAKARLLPPGTSGYLLGTDDQGRDIFSRLVHG